MTALAKHWNAIIRQHRGQQILSEKVTEDPASSILSVSFVDSVKSFSVTTRRAIIDDIIPDASNDSSALDQFAYTLSGLIEWSQSKIVTLTDELVDVDYETDNRYLDVIYDKYNMIKEIQEDLDVYFMLKVIVNMELADSKNN